MRLWTSRLDPQEALAAELAPLYAQRLEYELYYRHRKHGLCRGSAVATLLGACGFRAFEDTCGKFTARTLRKVASEGGPAK